MNAKLLILIHFWIDQCAMISKSQPIPDFLLICVWGQLMTTIVERVELGSPHRAIIARIRHCIASRVTASSNDKSKSDPAALGYLRFSRAGVVLMWALAIVVAVAVLHLYQVVTLNYQRDFMLHRHKSLNTCFEWV
jgi:hypothetical protein